MLALILAAPGLMVRSLGRVSSRPALPHVASGRGHPLMLLDLAVAADLPSTLLSTSAVTLVETLPSDPPATSYSYLQRDPLQRVRAA